MGVSRQFLNLIVDNGIQGAKSLRCIHLHKLFKTRTPAVLPPPKGNRSESDSERPPQDEAAASPIRRRKIREIQLPEPTMNFRGSISKASNWYVDCLPLAGPKLLCVDPYPSDSCRTLLFDVNTRQVETIPYFHLQKRKPLLPSLVPLPSSSSADDATENDGNGSFYIFEASPYQEELQAGAGDDDKAGQQLSNQFEAFVYNSVSKSWKRQLLPPPPFVVCDANNYEQRRRAPDITSYAVVQRGGGGSHAILVSADGAGTYCLDTVTHTWSHVADCWVLPFTGKVEYVPELKLWFGICTEGRQLGAADLSTVYDSQSQPQLVGTWKELETPGDWRELGPKPPQLVNLGSGRFCITRFFFQALPDHLAFYAYFDYRYRFEEEQFTVLTGVDVVPCVVHDSHGTASDTLSDGNGSKGKVELQMIRHNSRRHINDGSDGCTIEKVF